MNKYKDLSFKMQFSNNKQKKKINREINNIKSDNPTFEKDILIFLNMKMPFQDILIKNMLWKRLQAIFTEERKYPIR